LFIRAQLEYLNRHWLEAEELLATLLAGRDQDAEARLMLATLYRHTGRFAEADECLTRLERMDSGDRWCVELARERRLLESLPSSSGSATAEGCEDEAKDNFFTDEGTDGKAVAGAGRVA
jgi:thioredoxin-like negative regulator of GroEL